MNVLLNEKRGKIEHRNRSRVFPPPSVTFTYSVNDSFVLAGALGRGDALRTALVGRDPQTLAL